MYVASWVTGKAKAPGSDTNLQDDLFFKTVAKTVRYKNTDVKKGQLITLFSQLS